MFQTVIDASCSSQVTAREQGISQSSCEDNARVNHVVLDQLAPVFVRPMEDAF
eukprot:SAG31_NODE_4232_length_3436_cov_1.384477_6_plen_53_part_00